MCNPEGEMPESQSFARRSIPPMPRRNRAMDGAPKVRGEGLVLGVDTCGPAGSVALARIAGQKASILGQKELAGRSYSATLIASVGDLLAEQVEKLASVRAIVVVNGPGSFTG